MIIIILFTAFWISWFIVNMLVTMPIDLIMLLFSPRWILLIGVSAIVAWLMGDS